ERLAAALQHLVTAALSDRLQLVQQAALAHARIADNTCALQLAAARSLEPSAQRLDLGGAADVRVQPARARHVEAAVQRAAADHAMRGERLGLALEQQRLTGIGLEERRDRALRRR